MDQKPGTPTLDPHRTALLVIDVQRALFTRPTPIYQSAALLHNLNALIAAWRQAAGPLIFIQHSNDQLLIKGTGLWGFHPDLAITDADPVVHKLKGNAFEGTDLKALLDARRVDSVVTCGLVTHGCVRATTQGALALGYRVVLAQDAHSSYSKDAADLIAKWNRELAGQGAAVLPVQAICTALAAEAGS